MSGYYWIASYPKSGNTWLRLMLRDLLFPGEEINFAPLANARSEVNDALDIDCCDLTNPEAEALRPLAYRAMARRSPQVLYRKVHDAWVTTTGGTPLFPPEVTLGAFYVVRDPRDVAVSWSHFAGVPLDDAIASLGEPDATLRKTRRLVDISLPQRLLSWSEHVSGWLDAPGRAPCLLRYEDMLADPFEALSRAATYAGIAYNAEAIERAVRATRFETLQEKESRLGFNGGQQGSSPFFRCGRSGGWRSALTVMQATRIEAAHGRVMERLGYLAYG